MQTQGSGGDADIESRAVHTVGQGEGGANRASSMETSIAVCGMAGGIRCVTQAAQSGVL